MALGESITQEGLERRCRRFYSGEKLGFPQALTGTVLQRHFTTN
jgi:hypothetical protein